MTVDDFENIVLSQRPASQVWTPVTDYSVEARRVAEGQHPQRIVDVFRPSSALDVGCGYNYLSKWVNEIAGHAVMRGCDKDNTAADCRLDITDDPERMPTCRYDLVVCREVLEHLTLLHIRRAVTNLCRLSSQFVYVTTRFITEDPCFWTENYILCVETSDDLDPTHITIANKDLYRVLFTLEGFRQRADLEERMDWQQKDRVLVYQRAV